MKKKETSTLIIFKDNKLAPVQQAGVKGGEDFIVVEDVSGN